MAVQIPLTQGQVAIVDDIDEWVTDLKWFTRKVGCYMYAYRNSDGEAYAMHRVIMEDILDRPLEKGELVTHVDGNRLNNRRSNLRVVTYAQNGYNKRLSSRNTSGYKGVYWHRSANKWAARISKNYKQKHLGLFNTPEEAHRAYCEAAEKYHGEFANFGTAQS